MDDQNNLSKESTNTNEETQSKKLVLFYLIFLLFVGFLFQTLSTNTNPLSSSNFVTFISSSLGSAFAFGFIPGIIALIRKILKKKTSKTIVIIYFVITSIFFLLSTIGTIYNNTLAFDSPQNKNNQEYVYSPISNEYSVVFKEKPNFKTTAIPFGEDIIEGETAELILYEDNSFQRAESFNLENISTDEIDKDYVHKFLKEYFEYIGFSYPTFHYEVTELGKVGSVRAYKTLMDNNEERKVTYFAQIYIGEKSVMILYVGCASNIYPTNSISAFLKSIDKK